MNANNKNSNICPKCATENDPVEDAWLNMINDNEPIYCSNCNEPLHNFRNSDADQSTGSVFFIRFVLIAAGLSGLLIFLNSNFDVLRLDKDFGHIAYIIALLLFISSALAYGKFSQNIKHLSIWAGILLILVIGYSYRYELTAIKNKVLAELVPAKGFQNSLESISFPVSSDGHFYIRASVNKIPITFLVDTGASDIMLSPSDAKKLGYNINELNFNRFYETANGMVRGSSIQLSQFEIGHIYLSKTGASVNEAEMSNSLLGMTFFKKMKI
ncbi:MAG: TIGR02281 family clan AA aspartic protease, partial [Desulfobacteraceae bacterium]|nr:TIGR02281 family clan AA aspartic protease [Desulfobacteraceae bacterium]